MLQRASSIWRSKLSKNRKQQRKDSQDTDGIDARQQVRWKAAYESATEKLLYSGEFMDKGEHIRILEHIKVAKRTKKQIHIVAAYTLYRCATINSDSVSLWSARVDGGLFGNFYAEWLPVTRYRLLRIPKDRLFNADVLDAVYHCDTSSDEDRRELNWKQLCSLCLFADENEYARWHLARYEDAVEHANASRESSSDAPFGSVDDLYGILGISSGSSQREIKAAYQRMAMKYHPDRGGNASQFCRVKSAYVDLCRDRFN